MRKRGRMHGLQQLERKMHGLQQLSRLICEGGGGGGWEMPSISIQKASDTSWGKNAVFSVF